MRQMDYWTYSVMRLNEWIVNGDNVNIIVLNGVPEDDTSNTTEAIDSNFNWCHNANKRSIQVSYDCLDPEDED